MVVYDHALQLFSHITFCPVDRIVAYPVNPTLPPAEVAADPARLSMWQARYSGLTYYRLEGCGHVQVYRCYWGGCKYDF